MQIMSFRVGPPANIIAIIYGILGILTVPHALLVGASQITLPVGLIAPLVYLSFNLHVTTPTHFLSGMLYALAAGACFALSGWLTGAVAVLAFNLVASRIGGIEASVLIDETKTTRPGP